MKIEKKVLIFSVQIYLVQIFSVYYKDQIQFRNIQFRLIQFRLIQFRYRLVQFRLVQFSLDKIQFKYSFQIRFRLVVILTQFKVCMLFISRLPNYLKLWKNKDFEYS